MKVNGKPMSYNAEGSNMGMEHAYLSQRQAETGSREHGGARQRLVNVDYVCVD